MLALVMLFDQPRTAAGEAAMEAMVITSGENSDAWGVAEVPMSENSISLALREPIARIQTAATTAIIFFVFIFVSFVLMMPLLERKACRGDGTIVRYSNIYR